MLKRDDLLDSCGRVDRTSRGFLDYVDRFKEIFATFKGLDTR